MSHLVDDNGGLDRFPKSSGIYMITHEPSGHRYIGRSKNLRTRLYHHLKAPPTPGERWIQRQAVMDACEEFVINHSGPLRDLVRELESYLRNEPKFNSFHSFVAAVQRNSDAEVLQHLPSASINELNLAEALWIKELQPELNHVHTKSARRCR